MSKINSSSASSRAPGQAALTPLLDTLFLLLFAVLASSEEKAARESTERTESTAEEIQIELPSVDRDGDAVAPDVPLPPVVVVIEANGELRIAGESAPLAGAQGLAALTSLDQPDVRVEIRAHADARHAVVVEVLHELQQLGVIDVRFVATQRDVTGASDRALDQGARR